MNMLRVKIKVQLGWCAIAILCASCATPPGTSAPPVASPDAFEQQPTAGQPTWPEKDWYRGFASQELDSLVDLAQQNNFDLAAAAARIRQADARARAAGAAILPQVDLNGNAVHYTGGSNGVTVNETDWSALLSASYEIDFWGKNRATSQSARLSVLASQAGRDTLALTTLTGVANGYFQVLSLRERLSIARANLESTRAVLQVIEARYNAGAGTAAELATQRAAVANAELTIAPLEQQEVEARAALALLVGHAPEGFAVSAQHLDDLSEPAVVPGLPAELLLRRPDVLAAETNLRLRTPTWLRLARRCFRASHSRAAAARRIQLCRLPSSLWQEPATNCLWVRRWYRPYSTVDADVRHAMKRRRRKKSCWQTTELPSSAPLRTSKPRSPRSTSISICSAHRENVAQSEARSRCASALSRGRR
jgi:hypothetical protein